MLQIDSQDVLLVEVERHIARLVEVNLVRNKAVVRIAKTREEGLQCIAERCPRTIVVQDEFMAEDLKSAVKDIAGEFVVLGLQSAHRV
jgi:DNA-binding response OmpR family regulator